jgi:methylenetetrahydrofolate dehydrogenase (NADP+)/methenyltetrahydrofolate cyclohydrolase
MAVLLDGKAVAAALLEKVRFAVSRGPRQPRLAILRVGEDRASRRYVERKCAAADRVGIRTVVCVLPQSTDRQSIMAQLERWNGDGDVDGILVQAPLPNKSLQETVFAAIDPKKDVDGFHPQNFGLLAQERPGGFIPCTAKGIVELLRAYAVPIEGRHAVVIGRSLIVGRPLALLLQSRDANGTVTVCHSRSTGLRELARSADILIAAAGSAQLVREDWVRDGAAVVDVGQNFFPDATLPSGYRLCGDVDFAAVAPHCSFITPVPGGVGPMTIAALMENVLLARQRHG